MTLALLQIKLWSEIHLFCTFYTSFISPDIKYDISMHHGCELKGFCFGGFCQMGLD